MHSHLCITENLEYIEEMDDAFIDLILIDPPFNSGRVYQHSTNKKRRFNDIWTWDENALRYIQMRAKETEQYFKLENILINGFGSFFDKDKSMLAYLVFMGPRLVELHRLLKDTGSLYLHCDTSASHYLKVLLDSIFGLKQFRNEIIWCYTGREQASRNFNKKHDTIFFYSKSNNYIFNKDSVKRPITERSQRRYNHTDENGKKYGIFRNKKGEQYRQYMTDGFVERDYWDIPYVKKQVYPTQKPVELYERMILASSNESDLIFDPFCGSGTTLIACENLNRTWMGIDISEEVVDIIQERKKKPLQIYINDMY